MKSVGTLFIGFSMLVLGTTVACSGAVPEQAQDDEAASVDATAELLTSIRATPETERLTGVFAWEVYQQEHDIFVIGLDRQGVVVVTQKTAVGADGSVAGEVTHPSLHKFTVDTSGNKVELVAASPQVRLLLERAALDLAENQAKEAETQEYSAACYGAVMNGLACAGAIATCASPATALGVGIVACFSIGPFCNAAAYCNYRCTYNYKTCDTSQSDFEHDSGCASNDMDCDGVTDDSGGSNASEGTDSQGNYGE